MASNKTLKSTKYKLRFLPDRVYIQLYYFGKYHHFCHLRDPKRFNEKLNWLKLHDHRPEYGIMVDKYRAKEYVADKIGEEYIVPLLGVWDTFDEIDFDALPNQFVLKCNHDSEGLFIVHDKSTIDKSDAKEKLTYALSQNFFYIGREWPYKDVQPKIIAEQYMEDHRSGELQDYKFYCFNGEPKIMYITADRFHGGVKMAYFDMEFNRLDLRQKYPDCTQSIKKPETFEQMADLARILSKGYPFMRVDFYETDGKIYFGEITLYPYSGFSPFYPDEWDKTLGDWLELPVSNRKE